MRVGGGIEFEEGARVEGRGESTFVVARGAEGDLLLILVARGGGVRRVGRDGSERGVLDG